MSKNYILIRKAAATARLEELRRLQEAAAERERMRLNIAQSQVSQLDSRFRNLLYKLDDAAAKLPDLTMQAPAWPGPTESTSTADGFEQYVSQLGVFVRAFEHELQQAIAVAEEILADRLARAAAWREIDSLQHAMSLLREKISFASSTLHEETPNFLAIIQPDRNASLGTLQQHLVLLHKVQHELSQMYSDTSRRLESRQLGIQLSGEVVNASVNAANTLLLYQNEQRARAVSAMKDCLAKALSSKGVSENELPMGTQMLIQFILEAEPTDQSKQLIQRLVAREAVLKQHSELAKKILLSPPDLLHANKNRSKRWDALVSELEQVMAGWLPLTTQHQLEHEQICVESQQHLDNLYLETDFVRALREQGFEPLVDQTNKLVLIDLENPNIWFRETASFCTDEKTATIAKVVEMETDAHDMGTDPAIIQNVCERMCKLGSSNNKINTEQAVIDRQNTIKRAKRPKQLKALTAGGE